MTVFVVKRLNVVLFPAEKYDTAGGGRIKWRFDNKPPAIKRRPLGRQHKPLISVGKGVFQFCDQLYHSHLRRFDTLYMVNVKRILTLLYIMFFGCRASGEKNDLNQIL
jgi:hypothetical protein